MQAAGKIALVTGAARRVGKSIALALAERGAHVVNTYRRSQAEAQQTQQAIEACGVHGMVVQGDITRAVEVEAMVQQVIQHVSEK